MAKKEQAKTESSPAAQDSAERAGLAWVHGQLRWFRKLAHRSVVASICSSAAALGLFVVVVVLLMNRPAPRYFAATPNLKLAPMTPLSKPVMSESGLLNWAAQAVTDTFSIDFVHWRHQLSRVSKNYTHKAFESMLSSLQSSGNLSYIRKNRLSVSVTATQAPVILQKGQIGGSEAWKIQMPLKLSYESSQGVNNTQTLVATLIVKRVSTHQFPRGVAIAQIVLKSHGANFGNAS